MTKTNTIRSLETFKRVRESEIERMQAELARHQATKMRFETNLARLDALAQEARPDSANGSGISPALALNCGHYKQYVLALAAQHRTDLRLHDANMAVAQRRLNAAAVRNELLGIVIDQHRDAVACTAERRERKREDELATQSWLHKTTAR